MNTTQKQAHIFGAYMLAPMVLAAVLMHFVPPLLGQIAIVLVAFLVMYVLARWDPLKAAKEVSGDDGSDERLDT